MAAARMRTDAAELSFATDLSLHLFGWQVPVTHVYRKARGRETFISESGPHGSSSVGRVSVRAIPISISPVASFVFPPTPAVRARTTQRIFLFETSCTFGRRPLHHPRVRWESVPLARRKWRYTR
jgi:hypothetical protein